MFSDYTHRDSIEHFGEYNAYMNKFAFLYYCRDCMMNFKTNIRVQRCTRCANNSIVELAAPTQKQPTNWKAPFMQLRKNLILWLSLLTNTGIKIYVTCKNTSKTQWRSLILYKAKPEEAAEPEDIATTNNTIGNKSPRLSFLISPEEELPTSTSTISSNVDVKF